MNKLIWAPVLCLALGAREAPAPTRPWTPTPAKTTPSRRTRGRG